ncbi:branched-chain amino acid ABC transporter permease [Nocardioides mangrovi]|uniref:Branched-chain amino acid ABC transporter permease n=1 Tax=Nocardioides mangrovi TaxID=2874580 RepID=A0ABS7U799_9ACTN|nr:branched-chain amino acid ABC transporter permease [Nocardioides mangrovi]MBZ5736863.1 branched-chain amino acid ABC transporter permease [Nocardioides mangrovi]
MDNIQYILNGMVREALSPQTAAVAIAVIGLNIHFGFTGLLNMGQSAFMLLGAYGFAISIWHGLPMILGILFGFGAAFIFALILGAPTLKLRGDYLAIVTISAAEIIRYVGRSALLVDFTGSAQGIPGSKYTTAFDNLSFFGNGSFTLIPFNYRDVADGAAWVRVIGWILVVAVITLIVLRLRRGGAFEGIAQAALTALMFVVGIFLIFFLFPVPYLSSEWWVRFVAWALVFACTAVVFLLVRSPWGRALRGIREDEDAIRSLGKNVFAIKMQALVIGGLFGALGGMVYVLSSSVQPDSMGRSLTFFCYTALLLGGAATIFGPVLGSVLFFAGRIGIKYIAATYVPDSVMSGQQTEQFSYIVVGVALMLLVIFRPQGILGNKRELRFNV